VRRCRRAQSLRLVVLDLGYDHLVDAAAIGHEGLRTAEVDALHDFDVFLMTEVLDHAVHGKLGMGERPATGCRTGTDEKSLPPPAQG
jgi:hypothetical protein